MSHYSGWLRDKLGKRANRMLIVRKLGDNRYIVVGERYFGDRDKFVRYAKDKSTVGSLDNLPIVRKNCNFGFADFESGALLRFDGRTEQGLSPEEIDLELSARDVKDASKGGASLDVLTLLLVAGLMFVVGGVVSFVLHGQLLNLIGGL